MTHLARTSRRLLGALGALLAACHGGGGGGPAPLTTIVFTRDNGGGGSDLYRSALDGSSEPINLTHHTVQQVRSVWPEPVNGRLVYTAEQNGNADFFACLVSPPDAEGGEGERLTTQSWGTVDAEDWEVVGNHVVVLASFGGVDNLFSVPLDGRDPRQITDFLDGEIHWPRDLAQQRNAVTTGGMILFEYERQGGRSVHAVAADGSMARSRRLSVADRSTLARDGAGRVMVAGETVILKEERADGSSSNYLAAPADRDSSGIPLTPPMPSHQQVQAATLFADRLLYILVDSNADLANLFSVPLAATTSGGLPAPTNLTGFSLVGTRIPVVRTQPGNTTVALVAEQPAGAGGGIFANVFSVDIRDARTIRQLSVRDRLLGAPGDIEEMLLLGSHVLVQRASTPNILWRAQLGIAGSETALLPAQQGNVMSLERTVTNAQFDRVTRRLLTRPLDITTEQVIVRVTTTGVGESFTNFFSVRHNGNTLVTAAMTSNLVSDDGATRPTVLLRKGDWITYARSGILHACRLGVEDSEIVLVATAVTAFALFSAAGQGAIDRVLYLANDQLFSARIDQPATAAQSTLQVASLGAQEDIGTILFNTDDRVVYTIQGPNQQRIVSSRIAGEAQAIAELSGPRAAQDRFALAF